MSEARTSGGVSISGSSAAGGDGPEQSWRNSVLLSTMMFLQYAIGGLWVPIASIYLTTSPDAGGLGFTGGQVGWIYALTGLIGAITAPFIAGQVADRYLNAERALALLLLALAVMQYLMAGTTVFALFLVFSIINAIAYAPTMALSNSISLQNLRDKEKQFPLVRTWGTIGWIVAGWLFGILWLDTGDKVRDVRRIADALRIGAVVAVAYAAFAVLLLPRTPPRREVAHPLAFARAFRLLTQRGFLVLVLAAVPIAVVHTGYFIRCSPYLKQDIGIPEKWVQAVMSVGQICEIFFLAVLGLFLKRLGYKRVLVLGGLAYVLRFAIYAVGQPAWLVVVAQGLHGVCFACFYAAAFIYVDRSAPADVKHSAQTVFGMILGVSGVLAGVYNQFFDRFTRPVMAEVVREGGGAASAPAKPSAAARPVVSMTRSDGTVTVKLPGHGCRDGDRLRVWAAQKDFSGVHVVQVTDSDTLTYRLPEAVAAAAPVAARGVQSYTEFWWTQAAVALGATLILLLFLPARRPDEQAS